MKTEFILPPAGWKHLTYHPLAEVVGFGVGIDVEALANHMKEHGYDEGESIILFRHGKVDVILDGRHKHKACIIADVTPTFRRFVGASAEAYVAKKAFRQHLNASQRAMIAATIANHPNGQVGKQSDKSANLQTSADAAKTMNVGERSVGDAKKVIANGTPILQEAVADGTLSVSDAAKVSGEPEKVQNEAVKKVRKGKAKTAAKAIDTEEPKTLDGLKMPVPESLEEIFDQCGEFRSIMHAIADARSRSKKLGEHKAGGWIDHQDIDRVLKQAHAHLRFAMPFTECPKCRRKLEKKCQACKGTGWINETVYGSSASDDDKKWIEERT